MIQITPQMRILLAIEPVDFRKGIDGLAACCRQVLGTDALGGALGTGSVRGLKFPIRLDQAPARRFRGGGLVDRYDPGLVVGWSRS